MEIFISMLRGINVSGKNKIPMPALKALYEDLKCKDITTYIQSGNVIFSDNNTHVKDLSEKIEQKIFAQYAFTVPVIIRTVDEWQAVIHHNPFLKEKHLDTTKLHVTFLAENPDQASVEKIKELPYKPDECILQGKEIYVYCPNGYGRTKLTNTFFEKKLKVRATTRNWRTVNELWKIATS